MKKYLMIAVAGLAIASCNKMDGTMSQSELDQSKYNQAFLKYLGAPIAPNQTWGFSSDAYTTRAAFTRAVPNITFPTFRDSSCPSMPTKYSNTVPEDAKYAKVYQNYQQGDVIYINTAYQELNQPQNTQDLTIYVDGNVTLKQGTNQNGNGTTICVTENSTLKLYSVSERLTVYLAPNATLDLSESYAQDWSDGSGQWKKVENPTYTFTKDNAALYMSEGSKIVCPSELYFKDGYTVLNEGGTIDVNNLHVENGAILYNKKKIDVDGVIALRNTDGEIVNYNEIDAASMTLDAGAKFYNVAGGQVDITGLTKLNNDSGTNAWQNGGKFNTGSFEITGGCQDPAAFNNCHMTVTGKFFMNHGNFVLDGGAAVECGSFEWKDDNYFHMGGKALLNVTGELLANNDDTGYGFYGDGTEYAVIQAGSVKKGSSGKFCAAYFGNIFVDTNNHFTQGEDNAQGTWYTFGDNVKFSFTDNTDVSGYQTSGAKTAQKATNFSIDIPADAAGCSPGYHWGDNTPTGDIRIIAEDLSAQGASDFDFNDVVLDVKFGSKAQILLTHAGGTLPLCIGVKDLAHEVHNLFGVWKGDFPTQDNATVEKQEMVNTGAGPSKPAVDITNLMNVAINDAAAANTNLRLYVYKNGTWQEMTAPQGEPACKLAVDSNYKVLRERESIKGKYELFVEWATNANFTSKWW